MPSPNVTNLMSNLTLEEKIGQIMLIGFEGLTLDADLRDMIEHYHIGSVIYYARNVASPQQVARLNAELQQTALDSGHPGLIISIDQEGGRVTRLYENQGFTEFPSAMALSATDNLDEVRQSARLMAAELKALGFNCDMAPDLDVNNNPANPVIGTRSFGSDPQRVADYGVTYLQTLQSAGILPVGKHFPGHGDTGLDSHINLPTVPHDRARLDAIELAPFKAAIQADVAALMSAHITFPAIEPTPGLPATLSQQVLTGLLRNELGFDGLIFTDELGMGALGEGGYPPPQAAVAALKAGADVLLFNLDYALHRETHRLLVAALESGEIPMSRLDDAVRRILSVKERFGILQPAPIDLDHLGDQVGTTDHRSRMDTIAAHSITLLRDTDHAIPLTSTAYVIEVPAARGLAAALDATAISSDANPTAANIRTAVGLVRSKRPIVVGLVNTAANPNQARLVQALIDAHATVIVVALRDPYDLAAVPDAPTMLASYGTTPSSLRALAAVLKGAVVAQGKLPVDLPGLFPLGAGISQQP